VHLAQKILVNSNGSKTNWSLVTRSIPQG